MVFVTPDRPVNDLHQHAFTNMIFETAEHEVPSELFIKPLCLHNATENDLRQSIDGWIISWRDRMNEGEWNFGTDFE